MLRIATDDNNCKEKITTIISIIGTLEITRPKISCSDSITMWSGLSGSDLPSTQRTERSIGGHLVSAQCTAHSLPGQNNNRMKHDVKIRNSTNN